MSSSVSLQIKHLFVLALAITSSFNAWAKEIAEQLADMGRASGERLINGSAQWSVTVALPGSPTTYRVNVLKDGTKTRYTGYVVPKEAKAVPVFIVVAETNRWFVIEADRDNVQCRPWEHFFEFAISELLLEAAELRFVTEASLLAGAKAKATNQNSIEFGEFLGEADKERLSKVAGELSGVLADMEQKRSEKSKSQLGFLNRVLESGVTFRVNTNAGIIDRWETQNHKIQVDGFRWLSAVPTNRIKITATNFVDRMNPYQRVDWKRCVFVGHDPAAEDGEKMRASPRGGVLRLDTGAITRLPIPAMGVLWGCFLADRSTAFISHQDICGEMGLSLVRLETGEVLPLHFDVAGKPIGMPVLSPDKKTIALLYQSDRGNSVLEFQMMLLDVESLKAIPLGKPGRLGGPYSWLPDGSGIVLKRFLPASGNDIEPRIICLLKMDGSLTDLLDADDPLVIPHLKSILHETNDRQWFLCDLDGKNPVKYADGMKDWGCPAISPDGKEILWVRFAQGKIPQLHLFPFEDTKGRRVTTAPGFTSLPAW